jgi:hypothetical protein
MSTPSKPSKRLEKIRRNPRNDWSIDDVEALCREHDLACKKPTGSSHYTVSHPSQGQILTIPFKRPIKVVCIKKLVAFIDAVRAAK